MKNIVSDLSALNESEQQIWSNERVPACEEEVFTDDSVVDRMLELVCRETAKVDFRFVEPACGNGDLLVQILERRLAIVRQQYSENLVDYELCALVAVSNIYGIEVHMDNVMECERRLYEIISFEYIYIFKEKFNENFLLSIRRILSKNIIWGDSTTQFTPDGFAPIIFCEWYVINDMVFRRDFRLEVLFRNSHLDLLSDLCNAVFVPNPIVEYPPIHYLELYDCGIK